MAMTRQGLTPQLAPVQRSFVTPNPASIQKPLSTLGASFERRQSVPSNSLQGTVFTA